MAESDTASDLVKRIQGLTADADVVIFSKSYCPFCRATKELFASIPYTPMVVELDQTSDGAGLQVVLLEMTGQRTVPNVFIKGQHIGGNDAVQAKAASGELKQMLGLSGSPPPVIRSKSGRDLTPDLSDGEEVKERVKELIKHCPEGVYIFSKSYCPFCRKVKALFEELGQSFCATELDQTADGAAIQAVLLEMTKQRTVPSVFVKGQHVGGNDDVQAMAKSGELQRLLA